MACTDDINESLTYVFVLLIINFTSVFIAILTNILRIDDSFILHIQWYCLISIIYRLSLESLPVLNFRFSFVFGAILVAALLECMEIAHVRKITISRCCQSL